MPLNINLEALPYATPSLISAIVLLALGCVVFFGKSSSKTRTFFSLLMLICSVWLSGFFALNVAANSHQALLCSRIIYTAVIFIPAVYYNFIVHFLQMARRRFFLRIIYGISILFLGLLWFTPYFIKGTIQYQWGYSSHCDWIHNLYLFYFFCVFLRSYFDLYKSSKYYTLTDAIHANRIKYVLIAFIIALFSSLDFLSAYGINFYPIGFAFMIVFSFVTSYAIVKHKLMDIRVVIRKGALYSISISTVTFALIVLILTVERIFDLSFGQNSNFPMFVFIGMITILLIPTYGLVYRYLNQLIYQGSPDELSELNAKLMQALHQQERMKAVSTFAAGMAHEIKNPLTAIKTFVEYLPQKQYDPDFMKKFSDIVGDEVNKIDATVRHLLDFSKPKALDLQFTSINDLLNQTLELLNSQFLKFHIQIKRKYGSLRNKRVDGNQLKQAFLNIFLNSIDAMPQGGTLTITTETLPRDQIQITIEDTGAGIPQDIIDKIFDPFYTTKDTGSGLGLTITYGIIKQHGGSISLNNTNYGCKIELNLGSTSKIE